jgi:hypothetical protein
MLRTAASIRFTATEIQSAAAHGIDLSWVKTREDWVQANIDLIETLAAERFDLLEKIARCAVERKDLKLPAKLSVVTTKGEHV